mgnify:CR=1 FL=1
MHVCQVANMHRVHFMHYMHCMHVLHLNVHHMHGGINKRGEKEKRRGSINLCMESNYVINQDIKEKKLSYLIVDVSCFSKLKSRVQTQNWNFRFSLSKEQPDNKPKRPIPYKHTSPDSSSPVVPFN